MKENWQIKNSNGEKSKPNFVKRTWLAEMGIVGWGYCRAGNGKALAKMKLNKKSHKLQANSLKKFVALQKGPKNSFILPLCHFTRG